MAEMYAIVVAVGALLLVMGTGMMLLDRLSSAVERYRMRRKYRYGSIYQRYPLG